MRVAIVQHFVHHVVTGCGVGVERGHANGVGVDVAGWIMFSESVFVFLRGYSKL